MTLASAPKPQVVAPAATPPNPRPGFSCPPALPCSLSFAANNPTKGGSSRGEGQCIDPASPEVHGVNTPPPLAFFISDPRRSRESLAQSSRYRPSSTVTPPSSTPRKQSPPATRS